MKAGRGGKRFRGEDQSQGSKAQEDLEVAIAAQERSGNEVITGALWGGAKDRFVEGG